MHLVISAGIYEFSQEEFIELLSEGELSQKSLILHPESVQYLPSTIHASLLHHPPRPHDCCLRDPFVCNEIVSRTIETKFTYPGHGTRPCF